MRLPRLFALSLLPSLLAPMSPLSAAEPSPDLQSASSPQAASLPYSWSNVVIGGGGFVSGLVFHPRERGLLYARTDVGGAYRWDDALRRWIPLTDFLGMDDVNLTGIESLAIDPQDPERVYLAAGTYTNPRVGNGAILSSNDRGRNFQRCDMPFKMGGNEAGRGNGERLAVDPNDGSRLLFGSRAAGLWQSTDHGRSWAQVPGFPAIATSEAARDTSRWQQPLGINFILFEPSSSTPGKPTATVYAGVSTRETWLYRSTDGGLTWAPVPGQPLGLRPTRPSRASDGTLFFALGDDPGPNTMKDGAVWKFEPHATDAVGKTDKEGQGRWTNITPVDPRTEATPFGYGAVCADPSDPRRLIVSSFCRYEPNSDTIYRSTDGGRTWRSLFEHSRFDHSRNVWASQHKPHWMADLRIDPFDPGHALFVTGYGVYRTRGLLASDAAPESTLVWDFDNTGLEETVPLGLISPPEGAHLLSALGDIDGFRHDTLTEPVHEFAPTPRFANSESICFAPLRPALIARSGTVRKRTTEIRAAHSSDGGLTWAPLASEPPQSNGSGTVALNADGGVLVWTTLRTPPADATGPAAWRPYPNLPYRTADLGRTWTACAGLPEGVRVVPDPVDPARLYAYDPSAGVAYRSTDTAGSFQPVASGLPSLAALAGGFGGAREAGRLHAVPGRGGELWLATRSHGLHHSADGGSTWTALPDIPAAYSLGFGKPAPGSLAPTLFLAGQVGSHKGLFRSTDSGASWQRIDDDAHRFGWLNHVTGDPRVFGRVYFATGGRGIILGEPRP